MLLLSLLCKRCIICNIIASNSFIFIEYCIPRKFESEKLKYYIFRKLSRKIWGFSQSPWYCLILMFSNNQRQTHIGRSVSQDHRLQGLIWNFELCRVFWATSNWFGLVFWKIALDTSQAFHISFEINICISGI